MKKLTFTACVVLLLAACKKDNAASRTDFLVKGPWVYQSGGVDFGRDGTIDLTLEMAGIPACLLDNKVTFSADGKGVSDEGTLKCDPMQPQTAPFTWAFANNESQLTVTGGSLAGVSGTFNIRTLNETQLSIARDTTTPLGVASLLVNLKH